MYFIQPVTRAAEAATSEAPPAERVGSGDPLEGGSYAVQNINSKFVIRSTKSETISNDQNPNAQNGQTRDSYSRAETRGAKP